MLAQQTLNRLEQIATEVAEREGCILYDLEFVGGSGGRTLRVYIDRKDAPAGIEDCSNVSKGLNLILDVEDVIPGGEYNLEVSTPGVDRTLRKPWHFQAAKGKKTQFRLNQPLGSLGVVNKGMLSTKQLAQVIEEVSDLGVVIQVGDESCTIPFQVIEKAKLVFEMNQSKPNKKR